MTLKYFAVKTNIQNTDRTENHIQNRMKKKTNQQHTFIKKTRINILKNELLSGYYWQC